MTVPMAADPAPGVRAHVAGRLLRRIEAVRDRMRETERRVPLDGFGRDRESARNLLHYLALREFDLRRVQDGLADLGLSSLGRAEGHVLYNLDAVRAQLAPLARRSLRPELAPPSVTPEEGRRLLGRHSAQLFGRAPTGRSTRIMVTLPAEAAERPRLMGRLAAAGMDLARINCAHDAPEAWGRMIRNLRAVDRRTRTRHRLEMDLGGPRLRTGPLPPRSLLLKAVPARDGRGRRLRAARIEFVPLDLPEPAPRTGLVTLRLPRTWLEDRRIGERISVRDRRGRSRHLTVRARRRDGRLSVEARKSVWFANGVRLQAAHAGQAAASVALERLASRPGRLRLQRGDRLLLGRRETVPIRAPRAKGPKFGPAIGAIPAGAIDALRRGERVWFDGGRIGGTAVARCAMLRGELRRLGRPRMGIVLKIETRRAFEELPAILLSALRSGPTAVMLARGDLAVEVGFERLAEVQEELLWLCEAAHVPAIWATQVLEGLAQSGLLARAEVTDAAMGERAECVMLNKGPYVEQAVAALDSIVRRMQAHQAKKSARLRHLDVAERFLRATSTGPPVPVPTAGRPRARPAPRRNT